jgi:DNA-3-methyladenine glycosylase II
VNGSDNVQRQPGVDLAVPSPGSALVRLIGPLDIPASLELFRRNGDDLIDRWDGTHLLRTLQVGERRAAYACTVAGSIAEPALHVTTDEPEHLAAVEAAVRVTFVPPPPGFAELLQRDPIIARLDAAYPGLRTVRQFDLLSALVRCISAQQVNLRWAATTRRRLAETFGERHRVGDGVVYGLSAQRLAAATVEEIRALQFTTRKAEYIINVAVAMASGRLQSSVLEALPDEEVIARLVALRGIGRWTAEWILARTLGRPRVVAGDLGVRKAVGVAYLGTALPAEQAVREATAHWGASAGVAQTLLLHGLGLDGLATRDVSGEHASARQIGSNHSSTSGTGP